MSRVLIPPAPGTLCALGALAADVASDFVRSLILPLDGALAPLQEACSDLQAEASAWLAREAPALRRHQLLLLADMRYVGQSYEVEVLLDPTWVTQGDSTAVANAFHTAHYRIYAHADPVAPVEIIDVRLRIAGTTPKPVMPAVPVRPGCNVSPSAIRRANLGGQIQPVPVFRRDALPAGQTLTGPALVDQDDTTVFVAPGWRGVVHPSGNLLLERCLA